MFTGPYRTTLSNRLAASRNHEHPAQYVYGAVCQAISHRCMLCMTYACPFVCHDLICCKMDFRDNVGISLIISGTGLMGTQLNVYLVLQENIPLRTSQFKHIIKLQSRKRLGNLGLSTHLAGADYMLHMLHSRPIYIYIYIHTYYIIITIIKHINTSINK